MFMSEFPAQPPVAPSEGHHPDYEFIMNPGAPKKKGMLAAGGSTGQRVMIVIGLVVFLLIIFVLFLSFLSGGKDSSQKLLGLAQEQTEMLRISDVGIIKARESTAKDLAVDTRLTIQTDHNNTVDRLSKLGKKANAKELGLKRSSQTDQALDSAAINNKFDEEFIKIIQAQLTAYRTNLKDAFDSTSSKVEKEFLEAGYASTNLLLKRISP